jgi:hypothetical protein
MLLAYDQLLRDKYKSDLKPLWPSQYAFCNYYAIDKSNFNKWLNADNFFGSSASRAAVAIDLYRKQGQGRPFSQFIASLKQPSMMSTPTPSNTNVCAICCDKFSAKDAIQLECRCFHSKGRVEHRPCMNILWIHGTRYCLHCDYMPKWVRKINFFFVAFFCFKVIWEELIDVGNELSCQRKANIDFFFHLSKGRKILSQSKKIFVISEVMCSNCHFQMCKRTDDKTTTLLSKFEADFAEMTMLTDGWIDGANGRIVPAETLRTAKMVLSQFSSCFPPPIMSNTDDGEIIIEWRTFAFTVVGSVCEVWLPKDKEQNLHIPQDLQRLVDITHECVVGEKAM